MGLLTQVMIVCFLEAAAALKHLRLSSLFQQEMVGADADLQTDAALKESRLRKGGTGAHTHRCTCMQMVLLKTLREDQPPELRLGHTADLHVFTCTLMRS